MELSAVAAFWLVALLLIVAPGVDWAFVLGAALRGNRVLPAVGGLVVGYSVMTLVVAAGVGAVVAGSAALLTGISLVGGCYLVWLGIATLRHPAGPLTAQDAPRRSERATLLEGIGVSGLNPKGLLIFVALLPQFADRSAGWPLPLQLGLLGLVFTVTVAAFYALLGGFARTVLHARPVAARVLSRVSGVGMVLVGLALVVDRLR